MTIIREIQVDGHKLVALAFNPETPGPPIILIHGITGSIHFWTKDQLSPFIEHGPCYALSLPGHYPAAFPPAFRQEFLTAEMIAGVLSTAIRKLVNSQPVILVGHSTGGFAALNIAAYAPQLTRCVISIAGFVQGQWTGALGFSQRLVRRGSMGKSIFKLAYKLNRHWRPGHRASWQVYAADSNNLFAYPHLNTVIDSNFPYFCRLDLEAMAHYFAAMPDIDISFSLSHITVPTLVLTGDSDPIVPPTQSHLIAGKIPWADLVVMKGVGHLPFFENPAEYQQVIGQWLNQQLTN